MNTQLEEVKAKYEEVKKAERVTFERYNKAKAALHIAEEFVSLSEHDGYELTKAKADAYDARNEYNAAASDWRHAADELQEAGYIMYCLENRDECVVPSGSFEPTELEMAVSRLLYGDD